MKIQFNDWTCNVVIGAYGNGRKAIQLFDHTTGEPIATATVNVSTHEYPLKEDEVIIKNYSENEGILECLIGYGIVKWPHAQVQLGYAIGHVCQLNEENINESHDQHASAAA